MAKKYDTNPLDPDFPEKAKAAAAAADIEIETQTLPYKGGETRRFPEVAPTGEQTRKFAAEDVSAYSAPYAPPFDGQYVPAHYQYGYSDVGQSSTRKVAKIGLPENILTAIPYIPWYPGMIASVLVLLFVPKNEAKVRFHAAQGLAAHVAIWIVTAILSGIGSAAGIGGAASSIFTLVTSIMMVVFAVKAWRGKPVHIETVDPLTNWLEEKITPRK
jgi:uncharacterized membrane protein